MKVPEYVDELRAWERRLCGHLGLDPEQVFHLDDKPNYSDIIGLGPVPAGVTVSYQATARQIPTLGIASHPSWSCDGENPPVSTGSIILRPDEWDDIIAAIGPKPQMLTREQELMLKGLAAEAEERRR